MFQLQNDTPLDWNGGKIFYWFLSRLFDQRIDIFTTAQRQCIQLLTFVNDFVDYVRLLNAFKLNKTSVSLVSKSFIENNVYSLYSKGKETYTFEKYLKPHIQMLVYPCWDNFPSPYRYAPRLAGYMTINSQSVSH